MLMKMMAFSGHSFQTLGDIQDNRCEVEVGSEGKAVSTATQNDNPAVGQRGAAVSVVHQQLGPGHRLHKETHKEKSISIIKYTHTRLYTAASLYLHKAQSTAIKLHPAQPHGNMLARNGKPEIILTLIMHPAFWFIQLVLRTLFFFSWPFSGTQPSPLDRLLAMLLFGQADSHLTLHTHVENVTRWCLDNLYFTQTCRKCGKIFQETYRLWHFHASPTKKIKSEECHIKEGPSPCFQQVPAAWPPHVKGDQVQRRMPGPNRRNWRLWPCLVFKSTARSCENTAMSVAVFCLPFCVWVVTSWTRLACMAEM